ncbi:hypothetical protein SDC9_106432 [bioreactor metagenome]|uniref:Uncharacterized protein n=1 Tax=bioreactor metagenome TaxID=1076179 RepID=A0A645B3E6_9ZZZZ
MVLFFLIKKDTACGFAPDEDILRNGEILEQVELLMDNAHAEALRLRGGVDFNFFAEEFDRTAILGVDTGQNLHQRAFARAVFTDQREHLARVERQIHAVERMYAGKELLNPCHLQYGFRQSITSSSMDSYNRKPAKKGTDGVK